MTLIFKKISYISREEKLLKLIIKILKNCDNIYINMDFGNTV